MSLTLLSSESYATEGRRGLCTWDSMLGDLPAVRSLVKYQDDIECLKNMNADGYRFSISWSRILPNGKYTGPESINQEGVDFYNNMLDGLIANGIEPFVMLHHFDVPSALQAEYNGVLGRQFVSDFTAYADLCFQLFGDKVKYWATFNEPSVYNENGYQFEMTGEDKPAIYPYIAGHNMLLAHGYAVKTYRDKYQKQQGGKIGISIVTTWLMPYSQSPKDIAASQRLWDFIVGWYLDPVVTGDYPCSMKSIVRDRLPQFTPEEQEMLKGSYDILGINYYTARYARAVPFSPNDVPVSYQKDQSVDMLTENIDGETIGPQSEGMEFMLVSPQWLSNILVNLKTKYKDPQIYITENGYPQLLVGKTKEEILDDQVRIDYIRDHLIAIRTALRQGVNV
ncbi:family 1 glycosylhydrolase, partial [Salmonella sp. NW596]|uniref:family 1 glycosylhydrolase n=1 Tax=Salmonella sp. NW596 TaxID=2948123 RepID=UPI003F435BB1